LWKPPPSPAQVLEAVGKTAIAKELMVISLVRVLEATALILGKVSGIAARAAAAKALEKTLETVVLTVPAKPLRTVANAVLTALQLNISILRTLLQKKPLSLYCKFLITGRLSMQLYRPRKGWKHCENLHL